MPAAGLEAAVGSCLVSVLVQSGLVEVHSGGDVSYHDGGEDASYASQRRSP